MKTVYLLRHAKSSWQDASLPDHERPLNTRGRMAAASMAARLAKERPGPDTVLCSTAVRTRETLAALAPLLDPSVEVSFEDALYGAGAADVLARLRELPDEVGAVLVVGHNPGMQDLVLSLSGDGDAADLARVREKFPTGALARLSAPGPWAGLGPGQAFLEALVRPSDLSSGNDGRGGGG